jgi:hypothetical protein
MNKIIIDQEFIKPYFGMKRHKNYYKAVDTGHHIQFHFNGYFQKPWMTGSGQGQDAALKNPYFQRLIDQRRPTESIVINTYRRMNYTPVTKAPCHKVINSLKKIVKCKDWKIDYSKCEIPGFLPDTDTLEQYCEQVYPMDNSIENWAYKNLVRWVLIDPNALLVVMPINWEEEPGELLKPYSYIIESKDVYDFKEGQLAVFLSPNVNEYKDVNGKTCIGKIIIAVTADTFYECKQSGEEELEIVAHPHTASEMPAWILGGESKTPDPYQPYYESFIQCMLPALDDAARDASDLSAEKNMHIFSTMWYTRMQSCTACQGNGYTIALGNQTVCQTCDGTGGITPSPYKAMEINLDNAAFTNKNVPIPPAGYLEKDKDMVGLMRSEIQQEIYSALSSINMEFLCETPLNQSGLAKQVDRDELNNFVYGVAYHIVEDIIKNIYWFINEMRYGTVIPNPTIRAKMLPRIPVPQDFNFLSQSDAEDNLIKITGSEVSGELKDLAEMDFLHIKYADQPEIRNKLICIHKHNPFGSYAIADVESMLAAGMVRKLDVVLSIYINVFVAQLLCENTDFLDLDFAKQKEILYELAQAKLEEMDSDDDTTDEEQKIIDAGTAALANPEELVPVQLENNKFPKERKKERNDLKGT